MGCSQSKIENEEAVSRCKDRKLYMKEAVSSRNAFAAAHSSYSTYLKTTGAALSDYAHGEVSQFPSSSSAAHPTLPFSSPASSEPVLPPPPVPNFNQAPLYRAASMPEIKLQKPDPPPVTSTIIEEEEGAESDAEDSRNRLKRRGGSSHRNSRVLEDERGPPPPPPVSQVQQQEMLAQPQDSTYDYFFSVDNMTGTTLSETPPFAESVEDSVRNKEIERKMSEETQEKPKRVEDGGGGGSEVRGTEKVEVVVPAAGRTVKKGKQATGGAEGKRLMKSSVNLLMIFSELDDHFLKASECAHEVSKMLEATRLHYHSNFADNRGNGVKLFNALKRFS